MPRVSLSVASDHIEPGGSCSVTIISSSAPKAWSDRLLLTAGFLGLVVFVLAGMRSAILCHGINIFTYCDPPWPVRQCPRTLPRKPVTTRESTMDRRIFVRAAATGAGAALVGSPAIVAAQQATKW